MTLYVRPLSCGCSREAPCLGEHSREQWETWLEGIAEAWAEDRGGAR